jgi:hypothetical protein
VKLTRDNESKACELLARLADEQLAEDAVAQATELQMRTQRTAMQSQRNANLAGLLKTDADRATFAANVSRMTNRVGLVARAKVSGGERGGALAPMTEGGRGAIALAFDSVTVSLNGRDEARAKLERALVARSGARANLTVNDSGVVTALATYSVDTLSGDPEKVENRRRDIEAAMSKLSETAAFESLFDGITLTPDDADAAQKIIAMAQQQMSALAPTIRPATRLRINHARGIAQVVAGADAALVDLAPASDRATIRSRIVTVPQ